MYYMHWYHSMPKTGNIKSYTDDDFNTFMQIQNGHHLADDVFTDDGHFTDAYICVTRSQCFDIDSTR